MNDYQENAVNHFVEADNLVSRMKELAAEYNAAAKEIEQHGNQRDKNRNAHQR